MKVEYVRNLHSNYLRMQLPEKPEERRYQYCILSRGGIRGLLDCELRYLNEEAFLYYDITSKQNIAQLYTGQLLQRQWVLSFFKSMQHLQKELGRFLLDEKGCLWSPNYIFQSIEKNLFYFVYVPYWEEEPEFQHLLEFIAEHLDYADDPLVECIYAITEKYYQLGEVYLQKQIFLDVEGMEQERERVVEEKHLPAETVTEADNPVMPENKGKTKLFSMFESRRKKEREERAIHVQKVQDALQGRMVAECAVYGEEEKDMVKEPRYGATIYIEENPNQPPRHRIYTLDGSLDILLPKQDVILGKKRSAADIVIEEPSVSRVHAKIIYDSDYYLEDMNSTNGTFRNGLRMLPYEKCRLEPGDEIRLGQYMLIFR